jgi:hypothetical protein
MATLAPGITNPAGPYRHGKTLVIPTGAALPPTCVKCGLPISGQYVTKNFRWHPSWVYFLILIGLLFYVVLALVMQKTARVAVPFCTQHRSWRTNMYIIAAVLLIGWIPEWIVLAYLDVDGGWIALVTCAMILAGLIVLVIVSNSFSPVFIDRTCAKFKGAGEPFLATLPFVQG